MDGVIGLRIKKCCDWFRTQQERGLIETSQKSVDPPIPKGIKPGKIIQVDSFDKFIFIMEALVIRTGEEKYVLEITHCPNCGKQIKFA